MNDLSDYDYELPPELLAKEPPPNREDARLMVVRRHDRTISHHSIVDLPQLLSSGDCLVLNNTKVLPARLFGVRTETGGKWEGLFLDEPEPGTWRLIGETRGKLQPGETLTIQPAHEAGKDELQKNKDTLPPGGSELRSGEGSAPGTQTTNESLTLTLIRRDKDVWTAQPQSTKDTEQLLNQFGTLPLPPYIGRKVANENDRTRYQTTFAQEAGAIAAPTAGLHLTPALLDQCKAAGIDHDFVTLHVGIGTFRPVSTDNIDEHVMHSEVCKITQPTAERLQSVRDNGGRVVAIGTTSVRTLESASRAG
ncbi:MAG: S-adenosylmethionine:tRNA ribosyltransferase-isomerase, partial [Planctomycetaceae bacterium]